MENDASRTTGTALEDVLEGADGASNQPTPPEGLGTTESMPNVQNEVLVAGKTRTPATQDALEDDLHVQNISQALADAAPRSRPIPTLPGCEKGKVDDNTSIQKDDKSTREMYENGVAALDALYNRTAPQTTRPPKPKVNRSTPIDDFDTQVAEYVISSLMIALPQPQYTAPNTKLVYEPPMSKPPEKGAEPANISFWKASGRKNAALPSEEKPPEPEVEAVQVNYRKWDRELYSSLKLDRQSIRLSEILPGSPDDAVKVSMKVHALEEIAMQYEALSYVWGNPKPAKEISVNDVKVEVNPNLYDALVSLRQQDSARRVWIDAICVNQNSFAEKSREVQKMGQIYSQAKTVNVFLGTPASSDSPSVDKLFAFLNRDDKGEAADSNAEDGLKGLRRICDESQMDVSAVCKGFVEFCLQPWWGRVWTMVSDIF